MKTQRMQTEPTLEKAPIAAPGHAEVIAQICQQAERAVPRNASIGTRARTGESGMDDETKPRFSFD